MEIIVGKDYRYKGKAQVYRVVGTGQMKTSTAWEAAVTYAPVDALHLWHTREVDMFKLKFEEVGNET